ncbi:hypothetical protein GLOTRDRAFT_44298 [Gloeophyllum trabeum ATCC 11539]|uniref:DUF202 domain-containing protein n=1 Tax=Gloeophyllum trabeum (strain ATCC 11539 / FP-39264 / Madison 617) TaxID=670483 RepID=S7Q4B5_GLOTA|nr:uncharacterized protein GLOTRDRAFT_44298 [Gloeophyllum trabeum ATCC 11539]EPQ54318.1 hypothetical protein GLOTRDRAFT_44298 [Gloeophyllum trabeum ATCC 11539]
MPAAAAHKPPPRRISFEDEDGLTAPSAASSIITPDSELSNPFADAPSNVDDVTAPSKVPPLLVLAREKLRRYNPDLVLVNSGSVARDHLANERTVLAYVRTSLALASMGVALVQFLSVKQHSALVQQFAHPLGATGMLLGLFTLVIGTSARYFVVQNALTQGHFPVARSSLFGVGLALALLVCITFGVLVAVRD